jgi:glycosyltransferase involved in cell wall biosynthesis
MHVLGPGRSDVRVMRAATALTEAGCQVTVVDLESHERPEQETLRGVLFRHVRLPESFFSSRFQQRALWRAAALFLRGTLKVIGTHADVYHAHDVSALPACYLAARLRRKPLIFEAHEMPLEEHPSSVLGRGRRLLQGLLGLLVGHIIPVCSGVITVSPPIVDELRRRYHVQRIALVRNILPYRAVPETQRLRERLGLSPETRIALYQGTVQPNRSLDLLVRAARYLTPGIVVVIMGKGLGSAFADLAALIEQEGVADRVRLLPAVPYEELLDWTASADIGLMIFAPDYSPNVRMFLPNKLFEYIMAGLPVLTSELPAVVEIVRAHALGAVATDLTPEGVARAINQLFAHPEHLEMMRTHALQAAATEYSWEKEHLRLLEFYQTLFSTHASD